MVNVFIGWDHREQDAYRVAVASLKEHSGPNTVIRMLSREQLREYGYYNRQDTKASSEFTITRFLVPFLCDFQGFSIFMDCDVLAQENIEKIMDEIDPENIVSCVQHDYVPKTKTKMDGQKQYVYPRKNWSSVMVFNNELCKELTPELINEAEPSYLHRMKWAGDKIGKLNHTWNYLAGYYNDIDKPNIIHYTDGGPWFKDYENCEFAKEWQQAWQKI